MHPASNHNKTMSAEQLQIIPAYFGEKKHKFTILSYTDDSGKKTEYFILKEFEDYIGLKFSRNSVRKNCPGKIYWGDIRETKGCIEDTPLCGYYNQPDTILVPEPNLYKLLARSNHPSAEPFVDWVCDVVKQIREKGFYAMPGVNILQALPETQEQHHVGEMERVNKMSVSEKKTERKYKLIEAQATVLEKDSEVRKRAAQTRENNRKAAQTLLAGLLREKSEWEDLQQDYEEHLGWLNQSLFDLHEEKKELKKKNMEKSIYILNFIRELRRLELEK